MAHVMTPARRAALRKAQLASAAKRRRGGVGAAARRAVRQKSQYALASTSVSARRHVGSKGFQKGVKKAAKYTAIGIGGAAVIGGAAYAGGVRGYAGRDKLKMTVTGKGKYHMGGRPATRYATVAHSKSGLYASVTHQPKANRRRRG